MSEIFPQLGFQVGTGAIGGFIVGYAVKKISKLVAIVVGLFLVALIYLGTQGIISINYSGLWEAVEKALGLAGSGLSWIAHLVALLPFAGTFVVGLLLGFKLG